jgi:hypothetical protein
MILVNALSQILQTCYQSVFVKGEIPLSLLLLADTDHGKSQLILSYLPVVKHLSIEKLSDVSSTGLYKAVKDKTDPVTIVIPDFHAIISHRASVTEGTINALMTLLQDGAMKIGVGPGEAIELKGKRANLITAMTPGLLAGRAGRWRKLGFLRRMLPVHYTYSEATAMKIHASIKAGEYHHTIEHFILPVDEPQIVRIPQPIDADIQNLAIGVSAKLENRGFTAHKFFRVYAQARALLHRRNTIAKDDFEDLVEFSKFCNLDTPEQI